MPRLRRKTKRLLRIDLKPTALIMLLRGVDFFGDYLRPERIEALKPLWIQHRKKLIELWQHNHSNSSLPWASTHFDGEPPEKYDPQNSWPSMDECRAIVNALGK